MLNNPEPLQYTLKFPAPHTHYVEVDRENSDVRRSVYRTPDGGVDSRFLLGTGILPPCGVAESAQRRGSAAVRQ